MVDPMFRLKSEITALRHVRDSQKQEMVSLRAEMRKP